MRSSLLAAALPAALPAAVAGCSRPEPPHLTPESATVTAVSAAGIDLQVRLDAHNPNKIALSTRSVKASVVLDGKYDVGTVTVAAPLTLPAEKHTRLDVPLSVKWRDLSGIAALAMQSRGVPYQVDGTVSLGVDAINFDVPFRMGGTITHEQLMHAVANSLPNLGIPGLR
jgi:LEA14-like dessication related protein